MYIITSRRITSCTYQKFRPPEFQMVPCNVYSYAHGNPSLLAVRRNNNIFGGDHSFW
jgi:hypothetical protein